MNNERIDLTQFDWMEHHSIKHMEDTGDLAIVDVNAIQMIPDLIAELKRCYDFIESHGLDEDKEHKMVIDLRECSWECLHQLCVQAGVEDGTKEEMIARLLE